ncbi:MAG TPA: hypothetical protein VIT65_09415 [Microlunatus sp.]
MREPDATFADPRQAALYDDFNGDRSDLPAYLAIADEVGARHVVDVGCGTGALAVRLAERGFAVTESTRRGPLSKWPGPSRTPSA